MVLLMCATLVTGPHKPTADKPAANLSFIEGSERRDFHLPYLDFHLPYLDQWGLPQWGWGGGGASINARFWAQHHSY